MARSFGEIAFTPAVKEQQVRHGSRRQYQRMEDYAPGEQGLSESEAEFLAARDSFYMATVGETGWPYVQHRGGPKGFVQVIDPTTIAFADFRGNKQYISVGNLSQDNRVALIFVDYPSRSRLKLLGRVEVVEGKEARAKLPKDYPAVVERLFLIHVEAFDWNCPQHITPRFTEQEIEAAMAPVRARINELERENERLKNELRAMAGEPAAIH